MCPFDGSFQAGSGRGNGARDKAIRVLKMAWLLQQDSRTIEALAEQFGVSRRTVYRDLKLLDEAGLPLVTQQAGRGYRVMAYRPPPPGNAGARPSWA